MPTRACCRVEKTGRRSLAAMIGMALLAANASASAQVLTIAGDVRAVRVWAYGTPPEGDRRDLFLQDPVYVRDLLETADGGALHVHLRDDTELRLGSSTRILLDEFVYQPEADAETVLVNITKGVARFITGKVTNKNFVVNSPAASIVARGTTFSVWIAEDGTTTVWVQEGQVEVRPHNGRPAAAVDAGEIVAAPLDGDIRLDAPRPAPEPGIGPTPRVQQKRGKNK